MAEGHCFVSPSDTRVALGVYRLEARCGPVILLDVVKSSSQNGHPVLEWWAV
jgi:hypothetical protein